MQTKKLMTVTMLIAIAILLQIVESMFPIPMFIPGVKLGLANIIALITLYLYTPKELILVSSMRVILVAILYSGFGITFILSMSGTIFACIAMILAKKHTKMSIFGIGIVGSNFHIIGQLTAISILYQTQAFLFSYLPILLLISIISGLCISYLANQTLQRIAFQST